MTAPHDKDIRRNYPIGTERVRLDAKGRRVVYVKVRDDLSPSDRNWMPRARSRWIAAHGEPPTGHRVVAKDLDPRHDRLGNLVCLNSGDIIALWHTLNAKRSEEQMRRCHAGASVHNRLRGRLNRAQRLLDERWYAVDPDRRLVVGQGETSRGRLLRCSKLPGVPCAANGRGWLGSVLGVPGLQAQTAAIVAALRAARGVKMTGAELLVRANALRVRHGEKPLTSDGMTCALWQARREDLVLSERRGCTPSLYCASDKALALPGRPWHLVARQGKALDGPPWDRCAGIHENGDVKGLRAVRDSDGVRQLALCISGGGR